MRLLPATTEDRSRVLAALILFQILCASFFVFDIFADLGAYDAALAHLIPEIGATIGLCIGIAVEVALLVSLMRRQERMARGLSIAAGELADLMAEFFRGWGLTGAEQDVATFAIKGFSIGEIAGLRGSSEGTIKSHLNAIYRKAGVTGRSQLVALIVEDLFRAPLAGPAGADPADATAAPGAKPAKGPRVGGILP